MNKLLEIQTHNKLVQLTLDMNSNTVKSFREYGYSHTSANAKKHALTRLSINSDVNYFFCVCDYALNNPDKRIFLATRKELDLSSLPPNLSVSYIYNADKKIKELNLDIDYFIFENLSNVSLSMFGCLEYLSSTLTTRFDKSKLIFLGT